MHDQFKQEIPDIIEFLKFSRIYSFCNYELSFTPGITMEQKEEMLDFYVEDSYEELENENLDSVITLTEVRRVFGESIKKDPITREKYIESKDLAEKITEISKQITFKFANELVDEGELVMYPDKDGNICYQNREKFEEEHKKS